MTVIEAISKLDARKFNTYDQETKVGWLSALDARVKNIVAAHEGDDGTVFSGYNADEDLHRQLLVQEPFDDLYIHYMEAQIDLGNGEGDGYNAAITLYNALFSDFRAWYGRNHMPKMARKRFLF